MKNDNTFHSDPEPCLKLVFCRIRIKFLNKDPDLKKDPAESGRSLTLILRPAEAYFFLDPAR